MGTNQHLQPHHWPDSWRPNDTRSCNLTTVRWPVNYKEHEGSGWPAPVTGVGRACGANMGVQSAHPGGALVVLGDGAVTFLPETIELATFYRLATRNDGQVTVLP